MTEEWYTSVEKGYVAARSAFGARDATEIHPTPRAAWDSLPYWDREEFADDWEVYEVETKVKIKKVEPPYA